LRLDGIRVVAVEKQKIFYIVFVGESNGKLTPRICPGCSVPEPYRSHDWALVPASPDFKAEY